MFAAAKLASGKAYKRLNPVACGDDPGPESAVKLAAQLI
jgi:hypothetical protein